MVVKPYFEALYAKTNYSLCLKMINKINQIEVSSIASEPAIENFIFQNKTQLELMSSITREEFNHLNTGMTLDDILLERAIIKKFS
jgi:hypothetical protein